MEIIDFEILLIDFNATYLVIILYNIVKSEQLANSPYSFNRQVI